ncbi:hypothetical protein ACLB2K_005182 [Fragaria x ananassa]
MFGRVFRPDFHHSSAGDAVFSPRRDLRPLPTALHYCPGCNNFSNRGNSDGTSTIFLVPDSWKSGGRDWCWIFTYDCPGLCSRALAGSYSWLSDLPP